MSNMGPKKKLTKKERARLEAELAEQQRVELEKERLRKIDEEKERKIREKEEAETRQKQEESENKLRRVQLQKSYEHFAALKQEIKEIYEREKQNKEWDRYMRCNGQPNAHDPGDLRKHLHIWLENMKKSNWAELNWTLKISEQSILTQDQTVVNKTCEYLKSQQCNLGDIYSMKIKENLGILSELESAVSEFNPKYVQRSIIDDLLELKIEFRNVLTDYADEFSYKILCNITRDMDLDGMITATFDYDSDVFKNQLYTVRSIPMPQLNPKEKLREETKHTDIDFNLISTNLTLPCTVKCENSAIRGQWFNYDHYSDYCPSYIIPYITHYRDDLRIITRREWKQRKNLLKEAFEQAMKQQEKSPESASFDEQEGIPPTVIDIDRIYTDVDEETIRTERMKKGVEALNLGEFDVNLRSHRIIGGIYAIDYLEQPLQNVKITNESLLRTVPQPGKLKRRIFYQPYKPPPPPQPGVRRLPEEIEAEIKTMEENLDKLALVTVQLPENVFWFEPPIVCRWETFEEEAEAEMLDIGNKRNSREKNSKFIGFVPKEMSVKIIEDFDLHNIVTTCTCNLENIVQDFVIPKLPDGYTIKIIKSKKTEKHKLFFKNFQVKQNEKVKQQQLKARPNAHVDEANSPPVMTNTDRRYCIKNVHDILQEMEDEPKELYVSLKQTRHILKIIKRKGNDYDRYPKIKSPNDGDVEDGAPDNADCGKAKKKKRKYMFSRFMQELDDLIDSKIPYKTIKFNEIVESLEETNAANETEEIIDNNNEEEDDGELKTNDEEDEQDQREIEELLRTDDDEDIPSTKTIVRITKKIGKWSTRDIHDVKFNEDKLTIQFRIGRLGVFGFAANRYSNLPYQTWEMKPDVKAPGSIIFSLTASVVSLEITVSVDGIRLNTLQGGPTSALQHLIGQTMTLQELMRAMRSASVDLFPDLDAFCYMEGSCEKNYRMETHLYDCMGELGLSHNFSWSRWNLLSGCRTCVLLIREIIEHRKVPNHQTLLVTPLKACVVDCTEVSPTFNTKGVPGMEYYADLHHLGVAHSQATSRTKQINMNPIVRDNITLVLKATRPLSFC